MAVSKIDSVDAGKLTQMLGYMKSVDELEAGLASVRRIEKLQPRPPNYEKVFRDLANGNNRNASRGALHVIRDVDSPAIGLDNVKGFEIDDSIRLADGTSIDRRIDVVLKNPLGKRLEYKAWEAGVPRWEDAELEFIKDILSRGDFQWVIKGTDLNKVATKMKQTLGVVAVRGRPGGAQMHDSLKNALDAGDIDGELIKEILSKIDNGTLLRAQGY